MSIEAMSWALRVPVGGNPKVILLGLANHAHDDGTEAYPSMETLAAYSHCDRRTAQRNVRKLEEDGWVEEDGLGPRGQTKYRLRMERTEGTGWGGGRTPPPDGAAPVPGGGGNSSPGGAALVPPEPSTEPSGEPTKKKNTGGRAPAPGKPDPRMSVPDGFPEELRPHARQVMAILKRVAEQHGAKAVWPRAVGLAVQGAPRKPLVKAAMALEVWAVDPPRPIKDAVSTYRSFLANERELAATERLDDDGLPTTGAGVAPRSPRQSAADRRDEIIKGLRAQAEGGA